MSTFSGGSGTRNDPYLISTVQDLKDIEGVTHPDFAFPWFRQTNDLDLSGEADWNSLNLDGSYMGMGYEITNLTSTTGGLFQTTRHGYSWNIVIRNANINTSGIDNVGIFCNYRLGAKAKWIFIIDSSLTAHGIFHPGTEEEDPYWEGGANVGAVVGYTNSPCVNIGTTNTFVEGRKHVGGVVGNVDGYNVNSGLLVCYASNNTVSLQTLQVGEEETSDLCRYLGGLGGRVRFTQEREQEDLKNRIQYNYTSMNIDGNQFDSGDALIGLYIQDVREDYVRINDNFYDTTISSTSLTFGTGRTNAEIRAPITGNHMFGEGDYRFWRMYPTPPVPQDNQINMGWVNYYAHESVFNGYPFQCPMIEIKYKINGNKIYQNDVFQVETTANDATSPFITMAPISTDWDTRYMNIKYMAGVHIRFVGIDTCIPNNLTLMENTIIDNSEFFDFEINDYYGGVEDTLQFFQPSRDIYTIEEFFNIRYNPEGIYTLRSDLDFEGFVLPEHHPDNTWEVGWRPGLRTTTIDYSTQERRSPRARVEMGVDGTFRTIAGFYNFYFNYNFGIGNLNLQGEGHKLKNMQLNIEHYDYAGIVKYAYYSNIENFKIEDLDITCQLDSAGIVNYMFNTNIKDVEILSLNLTSLPHVGPNSFSAGIVSDIEGTFEIRRCGSRGQINGLEYAGGIIGRAEEGEMHNCYFQGSLSADTVGGAIAEMTNDVFVSDSYVAAGLSWTVSARPFAGGTYTDAALWGCYYDMQIAGLGHPDEITRNLTERPRYTVQMQYPHDSMNKPEEVGHEYDDIGLLVRGWEYYWEYDSNVTAVENWQPGVIYEEGVAITHPTSGLTYRCLVTHYSSEEGTFHQTFPWTFTEDTILWGYEWNEELEYYGYPVFAGIPPHEEWPPEILWDTGLIFLGRYWRFSTPNNRWRYHDSKI